MFQRYAVFYTAPEGALATFGAEWLGWDNRTGRTVAQRPVPDIAALTATPHKYGLHGTLKAPFVLASTATETDLCTALTAFARNHAPVPLNSLHLSTTNGFAALRPCGDTTALSALAAAIVRDLDPLRAPLGDDYILRRRAAGLSPRQDRQMLDWGYPYIFDDFHFHLTLTGRIDPTKAEAVLDILRPLIPPLPDPFMLDAVTVMGEDANGHFNEVYRAALTGRPLT